MKDIRYLGLDVDSEKIAVAVPAPGAEVRLLGSIANCQEALRRLVKKLGRGIDSRLAGPHGYSLYWQLTSLAWPAP